MVVVFFVSLAGLRYVDNTAERMDWVPLSSTTVSFCERVFTQRVRAGESHGREIRSAGIQQDSWSKPNL